MAVVGLASIGNVSSLLRGISVVLALESVDTKDCVLKLEVGASVPFVIGWVVFAGQRKVVASGEGHVRSDRVAAVVSAQVK